MGIVNFTNMKTKVNVNCYRCNQEHTPDKNNYKTSLKKNEGRWYCSSCSRIVRREKIDLPRKGTPIHNSYSAAKQRCNYKKSKAYARYGGRGIKFEWNNFKSFYEDMKNGWFEGATLERIDLDGNYNKNNCCWATRTEQLRNTSRNIHSKNKAELIRSLYASGKYKQKELSEMFNDSQGNISNIITGRTWKD